MAQTGYTPISLYYSTTASAVPTAGNLANGELAINITDGKLYYKNNSGVVTLLAGATSGPAGGSNTQVQYNSSGVLAGSANMTFDGTSLTLGGNPTLSAGTANGVTYLNGSKVLTSGSALTFDGTSAQIGDSLSSADGSRFYVYANTPASTSYGIKIGGNANSYTQQAIRFYDTYFGAYAGFLGFTTNSLTFGQGTTEGMRLTSTGLGIGTSSPAYKLDVSGANAQSIRVTSTNGDLANLVMNSTGNASWSLSSDTVMRFKKDSTEYMRLDSAGNLGLGVTPSAWSLSGLSALQVKNGSLYGYVNEVGMQTNAYYNSGWKYITTGAASQYTQSGGVHAWSQAASGTAGNAISFTQAMTLDASGNLGVGTTSPASFGAICTRRGISVAGVTGSVSASFSDGVNDTLSISQDSALSRLTFAALTFNTGTTERFRIASNGAWGLAGANYGTAGQVLTSNGSGSAPTWQAGGGGGGGSPGGSNTQVQYNSSGSFAGSANFTFNGTGITTGNVNVTSSTNPTAGMYYNSTATSGLSFYNTGASGGSSAMQIYYGRSTMSATTGGVTNPDTQWYGFGSGQTPQLTIGSTASLYYFQGHSYRLDEVPYTFRIRASGRGDNGSYTVPESNGILFIDLADDYGGNASEGRNCIYVNNRTTGFGSSTNGVKVINNSYARQNAFYALLKIGDPNGGGQNFGYYAQIDTSAGANDNAAPVGLVIDNALVNNYTKTNGGAQMAIFYDRRDGSTARTAIQFYRNTTSNSVGTITTTNTATAYNTSSDYRLKENIAPLTGAIEKVLRLKPSTYTWKVDGSAGEGFIAHELQEVIPQAVSGEKDAEKLQQVEVEHAVPEVQDADGNIISHGKAPVYEERMMPVYQGVDSSFLVATLTAAIQEQQALIVALTARVAALEAK